MSAHLGTLIAVLVYYRQDVLRLVSEFFLLISGWFRVKAKLLDRTGLINSYGNGSNRYNSDSHYRFVIKRYVRQHI